MAAGIVIVGGGECGGRAAFALREAGYAGPVTLVGDERQLPYERPPLSKEALAGDTVAPPKTIFDESRFAAAAIRAVTGVRATAIDRARRQVALSDGTVLAYDRLLLATGAAPRRLNLPGVEGPRAMTLRTHDDAVRIAAALRPGMRLAVGGGGFIGLELAAAARKREAAVTVVEALPRVLARTVPEAIAAAVAARHRQAGVRILTGAGVAGFRPGDGTIAVELTSGERLDADLVVIGIGAVPVTDLAAAAGLGLDNGIAVDATLRTGDPAIFAAGDCCSFPHPLYGGRRIRLESWRNALDQAALAARNLLGAEETVSAVPWFWSDQHDLTLQIAGLPDEGTETVQRDLGDGAFLLFHLAGDGRLVAASGVGRGNAVAKDIRLAEMLIGKRARPEPAALASPAIRLKALLAA